LHVHYNPGTPVPFSTTRPHTLCGPARSIRTGVVRPIQAAGPGTLTGTFVLVRPVS
jgi:hypothetical protein